jgi:Family of unknown function (DUF6278)
MLWRRIRFVSDGDVLQLAEVHRAATAAGRSRRLRRVAKYLLRTWARTRGWELEDTPDDLRLLDLALGEAIGEARGELGGPARVARLGPDAGLFLGTVLLATVPAARWRLWPNGHPLIRLPSGRDLDVVAMASDRVTKGGRLLADIYAAAAGPTGAA